MSVYREAGMDSARDVIDVLEDAALDSMGRGMGRMVALHSQFASLDREVDLGNGAAVLISVPTGEQPQWLERLRSVILHTVSALLSAGLECDDGDRVMDVLEADGWVVNEFTAKTPAWMTEHREFPVALLYSQMEMYGVRRPVGRAKKEKADGRGPGIALQRPK